MQAAEGANLVDDVGRQEREARQDGDGLREKAAPVPHLPPHNPGDRRRRDQRRRKRDQSSGDQARAENPQERDDEQVEKRRVVGTVEREGAVIPVRPLPRL